MICIKCIAVIEMPRTKTPVKKLKKSKAGDDPDQSKELRIKKLRHGDLIIGAESYIPMTISKPVENPKEKNKHKETQEVSESKSEDSLDESTVKEPKRTDKRIGEGSSKPAEDSDSSEYEEIESSESEGSDRESVEIQSHSEYEGSQEEVELISPRKGKGNRTERKKGIIIIVSV